MCGCVGEIFFYFILIYGGLTPKLATKILWNFVVVIKKTEQ